MTLPDSHPLREQLSRGLQAAAEQLPEREGRAPCVVLDRVAMCTIAEIDHAELTRAVPNDVIAGVVRRFHGPVRGTALLALDPGDALLWLQMDASEGSPLEHFVELGSDVLAAVVSSVGDSPEAAPTAEPGALEERPLVAALLATHAPSDTVVLSIDAELAFEIDPAISTLHTPFTVQILLEPKLVQGALQGVGSD